MPKRLLENTKNLKTRKQFFNFPSNTDEDQEEAGGTKTKKAEVMVDEEYQAAFKKHATAKRSADEMAGESAKVSKNSGRCLCVLLLYACSKNIFRFFSSSIV